MAIAKDTLRLALLTSILAAAACGKSANDSPREEKPADRYRPKKSLDGESAKRDEPVAADAPERAKLATIDFLAVIADHDATISDEERAFGAARTKGGLNAAAVKQELEAQETDPPVDEAEQAGLWMTMNGESVSVASFDSPVKDQGEEGACTAFATVGALESITRKGDEVFDLAEQDLWSLQNNVQNITAALNSGLVEGGLVREEVWPYGSAEPVKSVEGEGRVRVVGWQRIAATRTIPLLRRVYPVNLMAVFAHLRDTQLPVVATFATNESWYDESGIVRSGLPLQETGHAVLIVGMKFDDALPGGGAIVFKNSWGSEKYGKAMAAKGLPGYGIMPFSYCTEDYVNDWNHYCSFYALDAERTK